MLAIMMYHKVGREEKHSNVFDVFKSHLNYVKDNYHVVVPGDQLLSNILSICLSFDDATVDFYEYVYPLLKELGIKALLGVPVESIGKQGFCSWKQLKEMVNSGVVVPASHSYSHCNLTQSGINLYQEIVLSKNILEERLDCSVETFIYPYGKVNEMVYNFVIQNYRYSMRIGNAYNNRWVRMLCRISGDQLLSYNSPFAWKKCCRYYSKYLLNRFFRKSFP